MFTLHYITYRQLIQERIQIQSTYVTDSAGNMLDLPSQAEQPSGTADCEERDELLRQTVWQK